MRSACAHTGKVVDTITPADLDQPTPCTERTVRELLNHTIGVMFGIAGGFSGLAAPSDEAPDFTADNGAAAAFERAANLARHPLEAERLGERVRPR